MKNLKSSMANFKKAMITKKETANLNGGFWIKTSFDGLDLQWIDIKQP